MNHTHTQTLGRLKTRVWGAAAGGKMMNNRRRYTLIFIPRRQMCSQRR